MLNISDNPIHCEDDLKGLKSPQFTALPAIHTSFRLVLSVLLAVFLIFMFLPWTQNVRADGTVTTLRPGERPQTVHATISGRIEHWYVMEGQLVKKGDTIVHISEVKSEYFDPQLVDRVSKQVTAKQGAIGSYDGKVAALDAQISAMRRELESKISQINNKIEQTRLKIDSDSIKIVQAGIDRTIAQRQLNGAKALYEKGWKSLTEYEEKRLKLQEAETKLIAAQNAFESSRNDLQIYYTELMLTRNEYANKIAKAESDKFSALSDQFDASATVNKLLIEQENYARRRAFYYITAPQDGYIVKAVKPGIGEIIKEGDPLVSIQPSDYTLAVEMYVRPMDLPLLQTGHQVRFIFDGWPAFFFSGWPGVSMGTFAGTIQAIDRHISANGKFRVLVKPDDAEQPWPVAVQPGGGAHGIALLSKVPVWWELWRVLNGFPPDRYEIKKDNGKKEGELLPKAPIKGTK